MSLQKACAVLAFVLAACRPDTVETLHVEPITKRSYGVVTRRGHDPKKPAPVLFALHPYATPTDVLVTGLSLPERAAESRGYLLVVPEGTRDGDGQPFWNASLACCGTGVNEPDDVAYLKAVLDDVKRRHAVDSERVFAVGASNGAFMAQRWACDPRGDLRAVVSISGAAQGPDDPPCSAPGPVRVLEIHGTADDTIRYEGGRGNRGRYPSARETAEFWRKAGACSPEPARSERWIFRVGTLRIEEWVGPRVKVALWTVEGGDHQLRGVRRLVPELLDFLEGT